MYGTARGVRGSKRGVPNNRKPLFVGESPGCRSNSSERKPSQPGRCCKYQRIFTIPIASPERVPYRQEHGLSRLQKRSVARRRGLCDWDQWSGGI